MEKLWTWPQPVHQEIQTTLGEFSIAEQQILLRRDLRTVEDVRSFFRAKEIAAHDPYLLPDMKQAVDRICAAKTNGERVVVYGDYDADGITAAVLLNRVLSSLGISTTIFIPDRFLQGYGLHQEALEKLRLDGADLVISVDCGIRAIDQADWARRNDLDLVITDHHEPGDELPDAVAVVDPKRKDSSYPFRGLAGVGIAYKVAQALMKMYGLPDPEEELDVVAIGTVADLAPLCDENRMLVARGLEVVNRSPRPGLQALMQGARLEAGYIMASGIGFGFGPRLNAAGRLGKVDVAVNLLQATDLDDADGLAGDLENLNRQRQRKTAESVERAQALLEEQGPMRTMALVVDEEFEEGIVGLVASRLADEHHRPAFVGVIKGKIARGSARSIPGLDINAVLDACAEHIVRFGGHAAAAGFTIEMSRFDQFRRCLESAIDDRLQEIDTRPVVDIEALLDLSEIHDGRLLAFLDKIEPCGLGNPRPLLGMRNVRITSLRAVGAEGKHLKCMFTDGDHFMDAIAFRQGHLVNVLPDRVDVAFHLERNRYRGVVSAQLNVQEIRPAQE